MPDVAVTVIGGGVVGLAVARELAGAHAPVFLLERNERYGMETSSRNSEVIHAGIYYAPGSLKATLCVEGKHLLYELCEKHDIPHRKFTKIITATTEAELAQLESILAKGNANGAGFRFSDPRSCGCRKSRSGPVCQSPQGGLTWSTE